MSKKTESAPDAPGRWVPITTAAKLFGVCTKTLRRWRDAGHIVARRPITAGSGRVFVDLDSVTRFVEGRRHA